MRFVPSPGSGDKILSHAAGDAWTFRLMFLRKVQIRKGSLNAYWKPFVAHRHRAGLSLIFLNMALAGSLPNTSNREANNWGGDYETRAGHAFPDCTFGVNAGGSTGSLAGRWVSKKHDLPLAALPCLRNAKRDVHHGQKSIGTKSNPRVRYSPSPARSFFNGVSVERAEILGKSALAEKGVKPEALRLSKLAGNSMCFCQPSKLAIASEITAARISGKQAQKQLFFHSYFTCYLAARPPLRSNQISSSDSPTLHHNVKRQCIHQSDRLD